MAVGGEISWGIGKDVSGEVGSVVGGVRGQGRGAGGNGCGGYGVLSACGVLRVCGGEDSLNR